MAKASFIIGVSSIAALPLLPDWSVPHTWVLAALRVDGGVVSGDRDAAGCESWARIGVAAAAWLSLCSAAAQREIS